jgi:superfamily I DNA/RNA helicase
LAVEATPNDAPARRRLVEELTELGLAPDGDLVVAARTSRVEGLAVGADMIEALRTGEDLDAVFARLDSAGESAWAQDAGRIKSLWADYRVATNAKDRDLRGFLRSVARAQRSRPSDPGVRVMTIHRAKGLEFRAVAVIGVREGSIPDYRARTPKEIDAERRSFYVAITRASRDLLLTWPTRTTDRYGRTHYQVPSRFLSEAELL